MVPHRSRRLIEVSPELAGSLKQSLIQTPPQFSVSEIRVQTIRIAMRDGTRLATELYLPPNLPAPTIAVRTPYGRGTDGLTAVLLSFARRGYVVVSQDCRGTGDSEPNSWDYYMYEPEDSYEFVEWIRNQLWFDGFLGSCGGSYVGQMQWQMALHPSMSTIVPDVSGLGVAVNMAHLHMFNNAYARAVGKGKDKVLMPLPELEAKMLPETLSTGFYNEPLHPPLPIGILKQFPELAAVPTSEARHWLWDHYCSLTCDGRATFVKRILDVENITSVDVESLSEVFGYRISHDRHTLPHTRPAELCQSFRSPVLLRTGWYDWGLNDALATWDMLVKNAPATVRSRCRLFIGPHAHNAPGYHEDVAAHPELLHAYGVGTTVDMLLHWYEAVREKRIESWPAVMYYLMGANEWLVADAWPPPEARRVRLFLDSPGRLSRQSPRSTSRPDCYTYDPTNPTPTVGGSILSYVYPPGSVDISQTQSRSDVLTYTTEPLESDIDIVGPVRLIVYASSSAVDTDFTGRLSDVFPDGRAIQLQNGLLRTRYRNCPEEPELLEPGQPYRFEIDLWATANRFRSGHRIRVDIASADFPKFDRNCNRGGYPGDPVSANQVIYHDVDHPSHLLVSVLP
jgi:uncharacterized protein